MLDTSFLGVFGQVVQKYKEPSHVASAFCRSVTNSPDTKWPKTTTLLAFRLSFLGLFLALYLIANGHFGWGCVHSSPLFVILYLHVASATGLCALHCSLELWRGQCWRNQAFLRRRVPGTGRKPVLSCSGEITVVAYDGTGSTWVHLGLPPSDWRQGLHKDSVSYVETGSYSS